MGIFGDLLVLVKVCGYVYYLVLFGCFKCKYIRKIYEMVNKNNWKNK